MILDVNFNQSIDNLPNGIIHLFFVHNPQCSKFSFAQNINKFPDSLEIISFPIDSYNPIYNYNYYYKYSSITEKIKLMGFKLIENKQSLWIKFI